jgi:uncharacterized membrane protein
VETVASRLQETGHQIVKQGDVFVTRTRDAGVAFLGETRDAGRQIVVTARTEAKRWRRFATQRASQLQGDVRSMLSLPAVERALLSQVDETLRALDARVRARLAHLERKPAPKTARKGSSGSKAPRARKSKQTLPQLAA